MQSTSPRLVTERVNALMGKLMLFCLKNAGTSSYKPDARCMGQGNLRETQAKIRDRANNKYTRYLGSLWQTVHRLFRRSWVTSLTFIIKMYAVEKVVSFRAGQLTLC